MGIDRKRLVEVLEFVAAERIDYSDLWLRVPDFGDYMKYARDQGYVDWDGQFVESEFRRIVRQTPGAIEIPFPTQIRITSAGIDFLKASGKSWIQRFVEKFRD